MKKFVLGLLIGIMLTMGVTTYAVPEIKSALFSPDIKLVVDGKTLDTQIVSVIKSGEINTTNYVPARALSEALGATVEWDGKAKAINVSTEETTAASSVSAPAPTTETTPKTNPDIPYPVYKVDDSGLTVYSIHDGLFYGVLPSEILAAVKTKGMVLNNSADRKTLQIVKEGEGIIVGSIPFSVYSSKGFISYDYFIANILPLLQ